MIVMSGWGGLGGYIQDLNERRSRAVDPNDNAPDNNAFRRACDWAARKGGVVASSPQVRFGCGPYWDGQQDYDPPDFDAPPPVQGGQCDGVAYDLYRTAVESPGGQAVTREIFSSRNFIGPCRIVNLENQGPSGTQPLLDIYTWRIETAGESLDTSAALASSPTFEFKRDDNLPDECGNPPGYVGPPPVDVPITRLPPDGAPVPIGDPNDPNDTTPTITFPPTDTPYDPFVPIINPPPGFPPFVFSPSSGDDIPPREGPETELPAGGTDGDDIPEPQPVVPSEICIGYAFDFYDIPANRGGIPGSAPTRYYEVFGSAQLRISTNSGEFYDLPVKIDSRRGVCYRSDESLKVIGLSLNSKVSFGPVRVKPIFVLKENKS